MTDIKLSWLILGMVSSEKNYWVGQHSQGAMILICCAVETQRLLMDYFKIQITTAQSRLWELILKEIHWNLTVERKDVEENE